MDDSSAIIKTLTLRDGQLRAASVLIDKTRKDLFDAALVIKQLEAENAQLRHHLNPPPEPSPATEDEVHFL